MTYDPNNDPAAARPVYTETVETVVVKESNTGWWIAAGLGVLVVLFVFWMLANGRGEDSTDAELRAQAAEAQVTAQAIQAQSDADRALLASQVATNQQGVDIARADAARAQAEAARAANEARAAEARATTPPAPVVIQQAPAPAEPAPQRY